MKYKRIFLIGFRTTGKTTIGKILAEKLGWSFWDCDFLITQEAGQGIETLTKKGADWTKFRKIENEVLFELSKLSEAVISCGGGVGVNDLVDKDTGKTFGDLNKEILDDSKDSLTVLLFSSKEKIEERLKRQYKNRKIMPFLNSDNAKEFESETDEEKLMEKQIVDSLKTYDLRKPLYDILTEVKISTDKGSLEETAEQIIGYFKK